jgi:hypothetical protein
MIPIAIAQAYSSIELSDNPQRKEEIMIAAFFYAVVACFGIYTLLSA